MPESLSAPSPAKLNLTLEVLSRRDDGYHELETVLQTLELAGAVTVTLDSDAPGVAAAGPFAEGVPVDGTNLALRAAAALAARTGRDISRLRIELEKRVPAAGGLGGGASDAATTLRLLQRAWNLPEPVLFAAAESVGSDESFFLAGGTAWATGRGERVRPLPPLPPAAVVLFVPESTLERKTARLFAALDAQPFDPGGVSAMFARRPATPVTGWDVYNAFERVAFDVFPGLGKLFEALEERIGQPIHLAGAGPTLFWIGGEDGAERAVDAGAGLPCTTIRTRTAPSLWR